MPGNHETSEACPLVDVGRKSRKIRKRKTVAKDKRKNRKFRRATKVQKKLGSPEAHGEKPFLSLRFSRGISHYDDNLAVKYAEKNFRFHSLRRFLCCCEVGVLHLSNKQLKNPYTTNKI